jgi:hypothetical protein
MQIVAWADSIDVVVAAWMFGSRSRGDNNSRSDLDIAVEVAGRSFAERFAHWAGHKSWPPLKVGRVPGGVRYRIDLQWYDPDDIEAQIVGPGVRRDGKLLWRRT